MTASAPLTPPPPAWLQAMLDGAEDPLLLTRAAGRCLACNARFLDLWGYPPPPAFPCTLPPEAPPASELAIWLITQMSAPPSPRETWHPLALDDGRHFEVGCRPVALPDAPAWLWIFRDVTRQRQMEEGMALQQAQLVNLLGDLAQARDAADRANAAKGQFLANMSHELRTPLHGVIGMARLASEHTPPGPGREYLDKTIRSAQGLLRIVNEVLDFSKIESGHMALEHIPFHLGDLVDQCFAVVEPQAREKGLTLAREWLSPLLRGNPALMGDPLRLQQVLVNLLGNAVKFTSQGYARLSVSILTPGEGPETLSFTVSDTGIGLTPEQQAHIFDEFVQGDGATSRHYGGTGLGLAISRQLCRLMGGDLNVRSQPHAGSHFSFSLPLVWAKTIPPADAELPPLEHPLAGLRILVVEDHAINQQLVDTLLRRWGATVDLANHGEEALDHLLELPPGHYQIILLDLQMPTMDGFTLADALRARGLVRETRLIALSAHLGDAEQARCQALGFAGQLLKPFEPTQLLALLRPENPSPTAPPALAANLVCPGLDAEGGLRRAGGDPALYRRLLQRFASEYRHTQPEWETLWQNARWPELARRAHTLKGLAATLGAQALADHALALQGMAPTGQAQPIRQALTPLLQTLEPLLDHLDHALATPATGTPETPRGQ